MKSLKPKLTYILLSISLGFFVSCKTLLAPEYDKAIVDKVTTSSEKTMSFLATVSGGTSNSDFDKREQTYNELIGSYDALKLQAKARPIPNNVALKKINSILNIKGNPAVSGDYPSAVAFEEISKTLIKMRDTDKTNGIKPIAVQAFKGQIEIFLDQAITYESFLKR